MTQEESGGAVNASHILNPLSPQVVDTNDGAPKHIKVAIDVESINNNIFVTRCMDLYGSEQDLIDGIINSPEQTSNCAEYKELQRLSILRTEHSKIAPFIAATMLYYAYKNISGSDFPSEEDIVIQIENGKGKTDNINYIAIARFLIKKYCVISMGARSRAFIFENGYYSEEDGQIKSDIQQILSTLPNTHTKMTDRITNDIYEKVMNLSLINLKTSPFLKNSLVIPTLTEAIVRCNDKIIHVPKSPAIGKNWYVNAEYIDNIDTTEVWDFLIDVTNKPNKYIQDYTKVIIQIGASALSQTKHLQQAYMLYGVGSNAKGIVSNLFNNMFGANNVAHLKLQDFKRPFSLGTLLGKVMNIYPEVPMNSLNSEACSAFKAITGDDPLDFEKKFKDPISDLVTIVMLFSANTLPDVPSDIDAEPAWWRRWTVINLPNVYEQNKQFAEHMTKSKVINQLFKLCVDDITRLENDGLYKSQAIDVTRELWRCGANNVFSFFINNYEVTNIELPKDQWISKDALYNHYKRVCDDMDVEPERIKSNVIFHPTIAREKCKIKKIYNENSQKEERYYINIKLLENNIKTEQMGFN